MKRLQTMILFFLFLFVLAAAVYLPPKLSQIQDQLLFAGVQTEPLPGILPSAGTQIGVAEKIQILTGYYSNKDQGIIRSTQRLNLVKQEQSADLDFRILQELATLTQLGILPSLDLSQGSQLIEFTLDTYTDPGTPERSVQIWSANFYLDNCQISLSMDRETSLIYEFTFLPEHPEVFDGYDQASLPQRFASYLGLTVVPLEEQSVFSPLHPVQMEGDGTAVCFSFSYPADYNFLAVQMDRSSKITVRERAVHLE